MESTVSVILPTYNERDNVGTVINEIIKCVPSLKEVIVVDDNSADKTWAVVEDIAEKNQKIKLIKRTDERGLAGAIWTGIRNAKGKYIVWMDCDMGMPPELIPELVRPLGRSDIAVGSRYVAGGKDLRGPLRKICSYFINLFAMFVLGTNIRDLTSGFIAARREIFNKIRLKGNYGEYCIHFLYEAKRLGYKAVEVPYKFRERIRGESKSESNFIKFGIAYIFLIYKLRLRRL